MEHPIKLHITKEDADEIQNIFDDSESVSFTILSRREIPGNLSIVEIMAFDIMNIWFLAKIVQLRKSSRDRRMKIRKEFEEKIPETKDEIQKLKNSKENE